MNSSVIIVAAGEGKRFKEKIPKQFVMLKCESIINLTIKKFTKIKEIKYILPVINSKHIELYNDTINKIKGTKGFQKILPPCFGGNERCISVRRGLEKISELRDNPDKVLIHDAARPNFSPTLPNDLIKAARDHDGSIPIIEASNTIKQLNNEKLKTLDRSSIIESQTPQFFEFMAIYNSYRNLAKLNTGINHVTDDVYEMFNDYLVISVSKTGRRSIRLRKPIQLAYDIMKGESNGRTE